MVTRSDLHRLVDELPEATLPEVERFLAELEAQEAALPAFLRDAPLDDEPESDEERAAAQHARESVQYGKVITDEQLRRELGL
jgi:hypothetical protein